MANRLKNSRCFWRSYSTFSFVHILLVFISASLARDITDGVVFPEQYNSSFPLAYQNSTSALGNRRRTSRWRTTDPGPTTPATTTTLHDEQHRLLSNVAQVPVTLFRGSGAVSVATIRSPQSGDIAQQSWTIRPRPRTAVVDLRDGVTTAGSRWTSRMLPVGSESPVELGRQRKTSEVVMTITKDGEETLQDSLLHTTVASDFKYTKTSHDKQEDGTDYVSDYKDHEENDDEEEDDGDDDYEDDEDYDDYDDDEDDDDDKSEFYNYDEDYEDNDNRRHPDSDSYEGGDYRDGDSDGDSVHQYGAGGDGNMRKPFNYTDYDYEPEYPLHLAKNHHPDISDPGSRDIRRLVINGKSSSHIDMSLLVIYAWLGLVIIMIAITILIFKYKQQLSARCLKVTSSCRKVRQVIGIEEGNNLLAHPLV